MNAVSNPWAHLAQQPRPAAPFVPSRMPTLEPVLDAIQAACAADLPAALAAVTAAHPTPPITLSVPREITQAVIERFELVQAWPTLTINGWGLRPESDAEQDSRGLWVGSLELIYYVKDTDQDRLARSLWRYAEALWSVLTGNEPFAGALLQHDSLEIAASEPGGSSMNMRGVSLGAAVTLVV